jgi:hypothetical protein
LTSSDKLVGYSYGSIMNRTKRKTNMDIEKIKAALKLIGTEKLVDVGGAR